MSDNPAENLEVESILPQEESAPTPYQLVPDQSNQYLFQLSQESSNPTTNPNDYELVPDDEPYVNTDYLLEKINPETYKNLYSRIDFERVAADYASADTKDAESRQKLFERLAFIDAVRGLSKPLPKDIEALGKRYRDLKLTAAQDLWRLEAEGVLKPSPKKFALVPDPNPNAKKELAGITNKERAEKAAIEGVIARTDNLLKMQKWIRRNIWLRNSISHEAGDIKQLWFALENAIREEPDNPKNREFFMTVYPRINKELVRANLIPDLVNERPEIRHAEAKNFTPDRLGFETKITTTLNPGKEAIVNEQKVFNILTHTIPAYFLGYLDQVNMQEPLAADIYKKSGKWGSAGTKTDTFGKPLHRNLNITKLNTIPEESKHGPITPKQEQLLKPLLERHISTTLTHEASHVVLPLLTLEELMEWRSIYEHEIKIHPDAARIIKSYEEDEKNQSGVNEMFSQLYDMFIYDPEEIELKFPKSGKFINTIISRYSSEQQFLDIMRFRIAQEALTQKLKDKIKSEQTNYSYLNDTDQVDLQIHRSLIPPDNRGWNTQQPTGIVAQVQPNATAAATTIRSS